MPFTARVKKTGQVFQATNEWDEGLINGRDAHRLSHGKAYGGHLFHTYQLTESTGLLELIYNGVEWATFRAEELEGFAVNRIRLHPRLP
jgi:hypothetical protein